MIWANIINQRLGYLISNAKRALLIVILLVGVSVYAVPPQNAHAAACSQYYMVQSGDDLYRIASIFGVDWQSLASVNGVISAYSLHIGQTLCIPTQYTNTNVYPSNYTNPNQSSYYYPYNTYPNSTVPYTNYNTYSSYTTNYSSYSNGCSRYHVAQWGENLFRIGLLYGVNWTTLASLNGINNPNAVYVGQTICVAANAYPYVPPYYCRITHTVQSGQNLYQIGLIYGMSWTNLSWLNNLPNPNSIYAGQTLCISQ